MVLRNHGGGSRPTPKSQPPAEEIDIYELARQANGAATPKQIAQLTMLAAGGILVVSTVLLGPAMLSAMTQPTTASARSTPQSSMALMRMVSFDMQRPDGRNVLSKLDASINRRCLKKKWISFAGEPGSVLRLGWPEGKTPPRATMGSGRAVSFLSCSMAIERTRFCNTFYRQRTAHRLKDFLQVVEANRQHYKRLMMDPRNRAMEKMTRMMAEDTGSSRKKRRRTGITAGGRGIPKKLTMAVANLSKQGYLSPADFGSWGSSVPKILRKHVAKGGIPVCP